jgi:hypothetical protein
MVGSLRAIRAGIALLLHLTCATQACYLLTHKEKVMAQDQTQAPKRGTATALTLSSPPRLVSDENGQVVGVILNYADYEQFLRILARHADWETLPPYLQDAIDNLLAEEAIAEEGPAIPLRQALAATGDLPS